MLRILRRAGRKTDSARWLQILLPWSWNWLGGGFCRNRALGVSAQVTGELRCVRAILRRHSSKSNGGDRFGADMANHLSCN